MGRRGAHNRQALAMGGSRCKLGSLCTKCKRKVKVAVSSVEGLERLRENGATAKHYCYGLFCLVAQAHMLKIEQIRRSADWLIEHGASVCTRTAERTRS